jgi:hypothetical protein
VNWQAPRAWVRILLPENVSDLHTAVQSIALHAMSASNVVDFNQTITFEKQGTSIPVSREAGTRHYLVAPLSITSETNTSYIPEFQSSSIPGAGRYAVRNGRIDLTPARQPDGSADRIVTIRTWVTSGALGNTVPAGKVQSFLQPDESMTLRINNPMPAAGGTNGESLASAQARFSRAVLSRDRLVTIADLEFAIRGFDVRITAASVKSSLELTAHGLARVQRVIVTLDQNLFQQPDEESRILRDELEGWLRAHSFFDVQIVVECKWAAEEAAA